MVGLCGGGQKCRGAGASWLLLLLLIQIEMKAFQAQSQHQSLMMMTKGLIGYLPVSQWCDVHKDGSKKERKR